MSLFIIPSESVFGKSFPKPLAKPFRKTSIIYFVMVAITDFFTACGWLLFTFMQNTICKGLYLVHIGHNYFELSVILRMF